MANNMSYEDSKAYMDDILRGMPQIIPQNIQQGLSNYIEHGSRPGMCLTYILENRLVDAFLTADPKTSKVMKDICLFIYHHAPSSCWGSRDAVEAWIKAGGWYGRWSPRSLYLDPQEAETTKDKTS